MLFQSQFYILAFLPAVAALYYAVASSTAGRQWLLIVVSLIFYGWWDVRFVILPVAQIIATWTIALAHERTGQREFLFAGIALNLISLGTFKYLDFLIATFDSLSGVALPPASIILPDQFLLIPTDFVFNRPAARRRANLSVASVCAVRAAVPTFDRGPYCTAQRIDRPIRP